MSLIKKIKFPNETIYDIGSKWSNIDKENTIYNSSNIISFNTEQEKLLKSCLVNIEPVQEGVGEPSPENVRPISGWTNMKINVSPTYEATDGTSYSITIPSEAGVVYGGTLDVTGGVLTVTHASLTIATAQSTSFGRIDNIPYLNVYFADTKQGVANGPSLCSLYPQATSARDGYFRNFGNAVTVYDSRFTGKANAVTTLANEGFHAVYQLAVPITYQLTSQAVTTLAGQNHIWADTGNIAVVLEEFYSDIQNEITINLNENKLLYKNSNAIISSNHSVTSDKLGINGDILNNYSLTIYGDTLTTGNFSMRNSLEQLFSFKFTKAGGSSGFIGDNLDVGWDWTDIDGSGIAFRSSKLTPPSSTSTSQPGSFVLYARKPNDETSTIADTTELVGYPNGLLTWTKNGSGVSNPSLAIGATSASTYNLYVNGPSYIKSNLDIAATTGTAKCSLQYNDNLNTLNFVFD